MKNPIISQRKREYWSKIAPEERSRRMSDLAKQRHAKLVEPEWRRINAKILVYCRQQKKKREYPYDSDGIYMMSKKYRDNHN